MDRNEVVQIHKILDFPSLSARRAWIEIKVYGYGENKKIVALRKESVDRNGFVECLVLHGLRRSPQGERG